MNFKGTEIKIGDYIMVYTSLALHQEIVMLKVTEFDEPHPNTKDHSGRGDHVGEWGGHIGFYLSQIVRLATPEDLKQYGLG